MAISLLTGGNLAQKGYRTTGHRLIFFKGPFGGAYFGGAYIRRGSSTEGNLRFKIHWASLKVGKTFVLLCICRPVSKHKPPGGLYLEGRFNGGFFALPVLEGLIHGGAYFPNFTVGWSFFFAEEAY